MFVGTAPALPRGLKVAAVHFLVIGGVGLLWPLLGLGPSHPEFEARSLAHKLGAYSREGALNIAFLVIGTSILGRRSWAPIATYVILAIATFYSAYQFAWGFAGGQPSGALIAGSFAVVGAWNGLWAFLVYRNRTHLLGFQPTEPAA